MSNQFQAFATSGGANSLTPTEWAALTAILANGFQSGVASSEQVNTALRQALAGTNLLGNFISDQGFNALDDGNTANLLTAFKNALQNLLALKGGATAQAFQAADGATGKQVVNISQFAGTKLAGGYQRLPGGLIIQWGSWSTSTGAGIQNASITFPIAFPNACLLCIGAMNQNSNTVAYWGVGQSQTASGAVAFANMSASGNASGQYVAIGY